MMLFFYTPGALANIFSNKVLIIYQKEKKKVVFMPKFSARGIRQRRRKSFPADGDLRLMML